MRLPRFSNPHLRRQTIGSTGGGGHKTRPVFALVLATVLAQHWFASTPLPWGGPNVLLGAAAALAAALLLAHQGARSSWAEWPALIAPLRPAAPAIATAALAGVWALVVHALTNTAVPLRLAQTALGIGVLCATCLAVDTARRAALLASTFVLATFVSALFGLGVAFVQDPFLSVWLLIADVQPKFLEPVWYDGRLAGLAADTPAFGYQLTVALPLALAALLLGRGWRGRVGGVAVWPFVMLLTLAIALAIDGSHSTLLAVVAGGALVLAAALSRAETRRRLPLALGLTALGLVAILNLPLTAAAVPGELPTPSPGRVGQTPAIEGLAAGIDATASRPRVVAEVRRLEPAAAHTVQVRARELDAAGPPAGILATAGRTGKLTVSWDAPEDASPIRYEFRARRVGEATWSAWVRLGIYGGIGLTTQAIATDMRHVGTRHEWAANFSERLDWSSYRITGRLHMARLAADAALRQPLGAGRYAPTVAELRGLLPGHPQALELLGGDPHNQFLVALVDYGVVGLALLVLLYGFTARALVRAAHTAHCGGDAAAFNLAAALGAALAAYGVYSLAHGRGPLNGDWGHWVLIALAFCAERIAKARALRPAAAAPTGA